MKQLRFSADLHGIRWDLEELAVEVALLHLQLALNLFNPFQPRVPAGNREGGRWTDNESPSQPAAGRDRSQLSGQELAKDPYLNRHIIEGHVNKTDQELIARVAESQERLALGLLPNPYQKKRAGTFESIESAKVYISETLSRNADKLERVANGIEESEFLENRFGYETGREAVSIPQGTPIRLRKTFGVGVLSSTIHQILVDSES